MKNSVVYILCIIFSFYFITACNDEFESSQKYYAPEFKTQYTIEEHLDKIEKRMLKRVNDEWEKLGFEYENMTIENSYVDILYSVTDLPEHFLAEIELLNEESGIKHVWHWLGGIVNDEYVLLYFEKGSSCFSKNGYKEEKKYFIDGKNGICAIEKNGEIFGICNEGRDRLLIKSNYKRWNYCKILLPTLTGDYIF